MATAGPLSSSSLLPLLESLEDSAAGQPEHTDAYLTIANRLSGEEGRQFLPAVEKHFSRLGQTILKHITSPNAELSQAALQALGFCVYHGHVVSGIPEILLALCSLVLKSTDKNTCTRALWVISKQSFPPEIVAKKVPSILSTLENVWTREDIQSVVMEHEALNVVIRLLEQVPPQMGDGAVRWAKLVIPLVVHSASKVRLRAAAAMEMGMPLLLEKQMEVAAVIEPIMSTKLIPELQKLFMSKNEANVLKLWPLFVRLLGKLLHRGGPFINSLLHLEELGFRSSSPNIKKIAFIAWKSLIDNFALNPDILSSAKRMKLLMQPLSSIHVRTEALLLTKLEVWWYLVVRLGPNLAPNFEQVSVPLLQCTIGSDSSTIPGTPARGANQNGAVVTATPKTGFNSPVATPRMSLNSSIQAAQTFPSIQLLGLEMLLHYFLGPEVVSMAAKNKLLLSLEPLTHPFLSGISSFTKHAAVLISTVRDGFIAVGKEAPGNKKDRQGCEVLTLTLQALQSIVSSEALPADRVLVLFEMTVKGIPQRVLGSASYQVGKMDVLNGTPALFLILLFYNSSMLSAYVEDERFFQCLHTLVGCGLSGPTSPLAFGEAVLGAIRRSAVSLDNKEQLWRMWSVMVSPLIETITQSNEVNQGDALEHNFNAVHSALMLPVTHLLPGTPLQQGTQKSMLITWSKLYKVFARCSALVVTAEENVCCEELCVKMAAVVDKEALMIPATLDAVVSILQVMVECVDFSPYTPQFQKKMKSPHTPLNWIRKKNKALGNLSAYQSLLLQCLDVFLAAESPEASSEATGLALVSILSTLFTNLALPTAATVDTSLLNYPDELRPILSQVKQKTPIILPGFEAVSVPDELSGQYSQSESSQLETKLSGVLVSSVGKRDSLLGRAAELKDRSSKNATKLFYHNIFSKSWLEVLEEEASIDFVFIPPETKERVLTEHQKEVKRTKRVDIPAMYNNLDASLDTTVFTQYTQNTQTDRQQKQHCGIEDPTKTDDVSNDVKAEDLDKESKESTSPNISSSSDLISGTPQKPSSRRQSFITLEKYSEGKPASPSNVSTFTGPHTKASSSQEHTDNTKASSQTTTDTDSQVAQASETGATFTECCDLVSPDSSKQAKVVPEVKGETKLAEGLSSERIEDEDDVIPDTQTDVEGKNQTKKSSTSEEIKSYSQGDEPEDTLEDSQCSPSQSSLGEPRRSGRQRVRPLLPGEDPEEREEKYNQQKKRRSGEEHKSEGKDRQVQGRPNTRSKQAAEEESGRLRTRSRSSGQMISPGKAQRKSRGYSNSQDLLGKDERKRRSTREDQISQTDSQTDTQSDNDSQSQSRRGRRSRSAMEAQEESRPKQSVPPEKEKEESSQTGLEGTTESQSDNKLQVKAGRRSNKVLCNSQELDLVEPTKKEELEPNQSDSQIATPSSQTDSQSQVRSSRRSKLVTESEGLIKDKHKRRDGADEELSQDDSQVSTPSASDSLSQNRLRRRSKAASGAEESEDKNETKDSLGRQDKSDSQAALPAVSQKEGRPVTRGRRSKIEEEQSQSQSNNSPSLTPVSSQSLNIEGSTESSQSRSRYSRRRSSQALLAGVEASESDSSDNKDDGPLPKRRGPRAKVSLSSPLSLGSGEIKVNEDTANNDSQSYQKADVQSTPTSTPTSTPLETKNLEEPEDSPKNKDMQDSKLPHNIKEQNKDEIAIEVELDELLAMEPIGQVKAEIGSTQPSPSKCYQQLNNKTLIGSPRKIVRGQRDSLAEVSIDQTSSQENDTRDSQATESLDSVRLSAEQFQEKLPSDLPVQSADGNSITDNSVSMEPVNLSPVASSADTLNSSGGTTDKLSLQVSESSEEKGVEVTQPVDVVTEKQKEDADSDHPETPNAPMEGKLEDNNSTAVEENQLESQSALDEVPEKEKSSSVETEKLESQESKAIVHQCEVQRDGNDTAPEQKGEEKDNAQEMLCEVEEQPQIDNNQTSVADKDSDVPLTDVCDTSVSSETISKDVCQDSPAKQKDLEAMIGPDVGQSPIGGRTRGTWSPSASPSTSILKKGQKRPLEEETPSPLVKSRRVSFADPIQHQELADDIDRRSPVIRTSSPKRSKTASGIPQPKYVTTPTKGLLILSPRNLRSPGSKSSKKCLISEMSQEPRPIPKDCVYPALVGCSTPVEAVLPQISSNMWPRGFGQLVRARNIKTVGDLSALTPGEIKTLPIRSPKISNVKKALKTYHEQQVCLRALKIHTTLYLRFKHFLMYAPDQVLPGLLRMTKHFTLYLTTESSSCMLNRKHGLPLPFTIVQEA
uniref:Replication timing regulatory factor 1 n=1 Tax=Myripristis murdjan TaxID=586833 RepID=A0A668AHA7_9TELE